MESKLCSFYSFYSGKAWPILSHPSDQWFTNSLNIAMPDLNVEYWITSFQANQAVEIAGQFPRWIKYGSLTMYDTRGMPIDSITDRQMNDSIKRNYRKKFTYHTNFCIILHVYKPYKMIEQNIDPHAFTIRVNNVQLSQSYIWTARLRGKNKFINFFFNLRRSKILSYSIAKIINPIDRIVTQRNMQMFRPCDKSLPGLFPNMDARYIVSYVETHDFASIVLSLGGAVPPISRHLALLGMDPWEYC